MQTSTLALVAVIAVAGISAYVGVPQHLRNAYLESTSDRIPMPVNKKALNRKLIADLGVDATLYTRAFDEYKSTLTMRVYNGSALPVTKIAATCRAQWPLENVSDMKVEEIDAFSDDVIMPGETKSYSFQIDQGFGDTTSAMSECEITSVKTPFTWWTGIPSQFRQQAGIGELV